MIPVVQQNPNPNQPGSAPPPSQQVPGTSVDLLQLQNLLQIQSQMGFGNRPSGPMNFPNFNPLQMGNPILGSAPQGGFIPQNYIQGFNVSPIPVNGQSGNMARGNPNQFFGANPMNMAPGLANFQNGQFGWQNQMQNMNQLGNLGLFNPSQVVALAQLMGCANQVAQAMVPQNGFYGGNPPQLGGLQPNGIMQQANFGQQLPNASQQMQNNPMPPRPQNNQAPNWQPNGVMQQANFGQQLPAASQQMQNVSLTPSNPMSPCPQNNQAPSWQGNRGKNGVHVSNPNHHQNKNFVKNNQRDASNGRFQKSHDHHHNRNMQGIENSGPDISENQSKGGKRRSLAAFYTEKEVQQWCEERKKNYPSKGNVQKKLEDKQANAAAVAEEAERRRQQLKEVLAKQVELGFEVPEIPSHYLLDSEDQFQGRKPFNKGKFDKRRGRFNQNNRFDKKRGAEGNDSPFRRNERFPKRPRAEDNDSSNIPVRVKKTTLLEKLLSTDIKRDQSRLLQAFRFMVMNSFFKDYPEKPLSFPKVIVKENGTESEEKACSSKGELTKIAEDIEASDDSDTEKGEVGCQQEEGEITD